MTNYTVGVGGDYSDWNAAVAAIIALGALADDYTFRQISDINNTTATQLPNINLNNRSIRFYCPQANSHFGDPTRGFKTNITNGITIATSNVGNAKYGVITVDGLNIINQSFNGSILNVYHGLWNNTDLYLQKMVTVQNILIKGLNSIAKPNEGGLAVAWAEYCSARVNNVKIWNCYKVGIELGFGVTTTLGDPPAIIRFFENISVYNCTGRGIWYYPPGIGTAPPVASIKNVVSCGCGTDWDLTPAVVYPLTTVDNCASSDATCPLIYGAGNIRNIVPADEFRSLSDANSNFLKLKETADFIGTPLSVSIGESVSINSIFSGSGQLYQTGSTNIQSWNTEDITGSQRPDAEGKVSIGANDQSEITGYSWDLDDGRTSTSNNPSVSYTVSGLKTVSVVLTYSDGSSETITKVDYITVTGYNFDFLGIPRSGNSPLKTVFYPIFEKL